MVAESAKCLSVETGKVSHQSRPRKLPHWLSNQPFSTPSFIDNNRLQPQPPLYDYTNPSLSDASCSCERKSVASDCPFPCGSTPGAPRKSSGRCQPPDQHSFLPTCATTKFVNNTSITCGHFSDTHTITPSGKKQLSWAPFEVCIATKVSLRLKPGACFVTTRSNSSLCSRYASSAIMSGQPHQGGYDDGYGQQQYHGNDAYYQEEHQQQGYGHDDYDYNNQQHPQQQQGHHGGDGYYDEA